MLDDAEFNFDINDILKNQMNYCDIEINSPITDEDLRYAQLEDLIFREYKNEFSNFKAIPVCLNPELSRNSTF
ncbi:hypothetical protein ACWNT8_06620 [Pigmentibacter ruber]|uniref:hypothetical protein n=1 Tax=Pigmentibacter ruber TaxID=2683196 RepID=UPI00131D1BDA|nr:hypothetical protein [Pigmentibacter ruber]BFD33066.1 hypothetical protein GTC16762_26840 [Pigmentibacter ruber]